MRSHNLSPSRAPGFGSSLTLMFLASFFVDIRGVVADRPDGSQRTTQIDRVVELQPTGDSHMGIVPCDLGVLAVGKAYKINLSIKNTLDIVLVLDTAKASCSCIAPSVVADTVPPGESFECGFVLNPEKEN